MEIALNAFRRERSGRAVPIETLKGAEKLREKRGSEPER
jgi:hypothetical protein